MDRKPETRSFTARTVGAAAAAAALAAGCVSAPEGSDPTDAPEVPPWSEPRAPDGGANAETLPEDCDPDAENPKRQMRGVWLTTVRNIDWPSEDGLDAEEQVAELTSLLDTAADLGMNAVFLQVRPTADAVYDSDLEPWARYLSGAQGEDPGYDPLATAVEEAHARGMELHAWFNPYRVGWQDADIDNLADDHPVNDNPDWLVSTDDEAYLDPGEPEVRSWVTGVVLDVVERYDIDGVHFDDYFYPYPGQGRFDDDDTWEEHGGDFDSRGDWRRDNVNRLVAGVHDGIQERKPWVQFGISPFGVWRNSDSEPSGSDTRALESYDDVYADTRAWIQEGWIDYVVPQLYWEQGHDAADYAELVPWWAQEVADTDVDLYIGQAAYRVGEGGFGGDGSLTRQLDLNAEHPEVAGDVYFSMTSLLERASQAIAEVGEEHYSRPALTPPAAGGGDPPPAAEGLHGEDGQDGAELRWRVGEEARFFAIYRLEDSEEDICSLADAGRLVDVVGVEAEAGAHQTYLDPRGEAGHRYHVTVLDAYGVESGPGSGADIG